MSANPIDSTNTDKPTGSLEDLFRHHLAEAAVPPRPLVWEQIDNSLLQHQNEQYRRRLTATRWVAAASIAIASLTGAGWWATHTNLQHDRADLAAATQRLEVAEASQRGQAPGPRRAPEAASSTAGTPRDVAATAASRRTPAAAENRYTAAAAAPREGLTATAHSLPSAAASVAMGAPATARDAGRAARPLVPTAAGRSVAAAPTPEAGSPLSRQAAAQAAVAAAAPAGTSLAGTPSGVTTNAGIAGLNSTAARTAVAATAAGAGSTTLSRSYSDQADGTTSALSNSRMAEELALLASRAATLKPVAAIALPTSFATVEVPADGTPPATPPARKWQFGASYAVGVFNPNINFSRAGTAAEFDYNPALGPNSPALSEAAAAEYRQNLRAGLSQRLAVRATRRLGSRLSLSTGVEVAQSRASSASSLAFVGEQVPDFGQSPGGPMRSTNFRYQTASVPVELRYANPVKRGLSLYGRVGAAVSALLSVRAEVEGIPEATRSYSIAAEGPYRRVLTNLRGGVGAQYRPTTGHWTASLGPTAEIGLVSLNAHPAQSLGSQSRAYSLGVEASVEFGRAAK